MNSVALYVELKAKPGKEEQVASLLASAQGLVVVEPGTVAWFAVRIDKYSFAIFDTFNDETGRQAHLTGPVAAALMTNSEELLAVPPQILKADVLAERLPASR